MDWDRGPSLCVPKTRTGCTRCKGPRFKLAGERGEGCIGGLGDSSTPRCECGCLLSKLSRGVDEDDVDGVEIDGGEDG